MTSKKSQAYINHVAFAIDRSGSMSGLASTVPKVFDAQIKDLAAASTQFDQETRATVYLFDDGFECLYYDKDVLRFSSLAGQFVPGGQTGLIAATLRAISELGETPQRYGDHAFLIYVITDGQNNLNSDWAHRLATTINGLPENWTLACLVPDAQGVIHAQRFGFSKNNIAIWDTSEKGLEVAGETMRSATQQYMANRATGVRGSKNLFTVNTVNAKDVVRSLRVFHPVTLQVQTGDPLDIAGFVEHKTGAYVLGSAFYELVKAEKIQPQKEIALVHKRSGTAHKGPEARKLLGLPTYEIKVNPTISPDYDVFVQSTSVNRKLVPGQRVLVEI